MKCGIKFFRTVAVVFFQIYRYTQKCLSLASIPFLRSSYLLLDGEVVGLDLGVDSTLSLGRSILVLEVLETPRSLSTVGEPDHVVDLLGPTASAPRKRVRTRRVMMRCSRIDKVRS